MNIVLASASPRRKELLKFIFKDFSVRPADIDEKIPPEIKASDTAEYLACQKARGIVRKSDELVIGCDTVVVLDDTVLGKPADRQECRKMLRQLSGRTHSVYTGVSVIFAGGEISFTEKTDVKFYELTDREIEDYMDTGEPFDKAGGYGIQGRGALFVQSISGDYFNVVGLPVAHLNQELKKLLHTI